MVFLYPETKHPLIPNVESSEANFNLAKETQEFRRNFFGLLTSKVAEISAELPEEEDTELAYRYIRRELDNTPEVKAIHQQRRVLQDRLWERVKIDLEGDRDRVTNNYESYSKIKNKGELVINPDFKYPSHQLKAEIHRMPGGYLKGSDELDFYTGAVYDRGVFLYGQGWFGSLNDELGHTIINNVLLKHYPEFVPQNILDMGCSVGHSTLPYAKQYPNAEVWGIDLGASLLKYGSARAKALDIKANFAQQNAENTEFNNGSFDLVVSHILLHEIPCGARKKVFAESYRLLKPGGIAIHLESKLFLSPPNIVSRYFRDTEVWVNSEPYLGSSKLEDLKRYVREAGFTPEHFILRRVPGYFAQQKGNDNPGWIAFCCQKI